MNDLWSDILTSAAVLALIVAGTYCPPMGLFFLSALITGIAAGWIKDEIQRRKQCQHSNRTSQK